jgi:type II secretory pathway pseudopilin PulG
MSTTTFASSVEHERTAVFATIRIMSTTRPSHPAPSRASGFSLIELLMVIAILFVLIGITLVALRTARGGAVRAQTLNTMRSMMTGYSAYTAEHNGRLLPGFIRDTDIGTGPGQLDIKARLKSGYQLAEGDTSSYVWRLAPYMDHNWVAMMGDYRDNQLIGRFEVEYANGSAGGTYGPATAGPTQLGIARVPSYGLNSINVGGDSLHGPADHSPWNAGRKAFVASRQSDVLNPTKIIVFAPSEARNVPLPNPTGTPSILGYCELRAPQAYDGAGNLVNQWSIDTVNGSPTEGQILWNAGGPGGTPISRLGDDKIPISHLDGHVTTETLGRLSVDLSRWIPNAVSQQ